MGNKAIEALFDHFEEMDASSNPMETVDFRRAIDIFYEKYIAGMDAEAQDKAFSELAQICDYGKRAAFETGFKTCVELLTR